MAGLRKPKPENVIKIKLKQKQQTHMSYPWGALDLEGTALISLEFFFNEASKKYKKIMISCEEEARFVLYKKKELPLEGKEEDWID